MCYILKRSKRKTIAIQITTDLQTLVRAPVRAPKAAIDRFVEEQSCWISKTIEKQQAILKAYPEPSPQEAEALEQQAKTYIPARVAHFSEVMKLVPVAVNITKARTRFGSCSPKNRLNFSGYLMQYPEEAIDYVVVHELAHIVHKNHGKAFYALVASVLPDYKERRALLKRRT